MSLPRVRIHHNIRNLEHSDYIKNGGQWNDPDCPKFYVRIESLAEVLTWNINSSTMRCRVINEDGTPFEDVSGKHIVDCSDKTLTKIFKLTKIKDN